MRANWMAALGAGLMLCGCVTTGGEQFGTQWSDMPLAPDQTAAVQNGVKRVLKDPGSAQFGTIRATMSEKGNIAICGLVNAKNGFGGYTGMMPFIGTMTKGNLDFSVSGIASRSDDLWAYSTQCRAYKIEISQM